jgi:hypothetical protein
MALLTVDELLARVDVILEDDAIQGLLDAAEDAINAIAGAIGTQTEALVGGGTYLILARRASSITSIEEVAGTVTTELDPDDFRLGPDGRSVRRLATGSTPAAVWAAEAVVISEPYDDANVRKNVQQKLVELELLVKPGLAGQSTGSHAVQLQQGKTYGQLRAEILSTLTAWSFA